jgi:hypothetical protein|tara:strand:- start:963 stop:1133 length:171 start_codon:yes stop_codon:yes gene_type:complete
MCSNANVGWKFTMLDIINYNFKLCTVFLPFIIMEVGYALLSSTLDIKTLNVEIIGC